MHSLLDVFPSDRDVLSFRLIKVSFIGEKGSFYFSCSPIHIFFSEKTNCVLVNNVIYHRRNNTINVIRGENLDFVNLVKIFIDTILQNSLLDGFSLRKIIKVYWKQIIRELIIIRILKTDTEISWIRIEFLLLRYKLPQV